MTIDILSYTRDGARVVSLTGSVCTCVCACGDTFTRSRALLIRKTSKMRCRRCYQDQMSEKALEEKRKARETA